MSKTKPRRAKDDELLLQASDVPDSPAVLLIDLSSIAHPIWHMSPARTRPGSHQPAHGGGRAVPGGGSSAHGDLLRLGDIISQGAGRDVQGQSP